MKKLGINDLGKFKLVGGLDVYRKKVAFVVSEINVERNDYFSKIYLYDGRNVKQFTSGPKDSNPRFSPDGKFIIFTSKREKESKEAELYSIPTTGGEARLLTKFKLGIIDYEYSPDGNSIAVITPIELEKKKKGEDVHIIKEIPFWFNGIGWVYGKRNQIYLVDAKNGRKRKLTRGTLNIQTLKWSKDGSKIYFIAQEDREKRPMISDLFVIDIKTKKVNKLTNSEWRIGDFLPIDDGTFILRMSTLERGIPTNTHIYHFNPETKEIKKLTAKLDRSAYNSLNCDVRGKSRNPLVYKEGWIYYIATDGPKANLFRVNLNGSI